MNNTYQIMLAIYNKQGARRLAMVLKHLGLELQTALYVMRVISTVSRKGWIVETSEYIANVMMGHGASNVSIGSYSLSKRPQLKRARVSWLQRFIMLFI